MSALDRCARRIISSSRYRDRQQYPGGGGGVLGGVVGGCSAGQQARWQVVSAAKKGEANVVLSLVNARTTVEEATVEGYFRKKDLGWAAGGGLFGGAAALPAVSAATRTSPSARSSCSLISTRIATW